jgi:large subunit ribosomal protein L30
MATKLRVTQVRSAIGRPENQRKTLVGLGLKRMQQSKVVPDNDAVRGMIRKVQHLVAVEPAD